MYINVKKTRHMEIHVHKYIYIYIYLYTTHTYVGSPFMCNLYACRSTRALSTWASLDPAVRNDIVFFLMTRPLLKGYVKKLDTCHVLISRTAQQSWPRNILTNQGNLDVLVWKQHWKKVRILSHVFGKRLWFWISLVRLAFGCLIVIS